MYNIFNIYFLNYVYIMFFRKNVVIFVFWTITIVSILII